MAFRSRPLLDLAHRVNQCQLQLPGVCEGFSSHGCEPAHSNQSRHGKGMSIKADDMFHVASCHSCHAELDQGKRFTREEKREFWSQGWENTIALYIRNGWLKVAP